MTLFLLMTTVAEKTTEQSSLSIHIIYIYMFIHLFTEAFTHKHVTQCSRPMRSTSGHNKLKAVPSTLQEVLGG